MLSLLGEYLILSDVRIIPDPPCKVVGWGGAVAVQLQPAD
jgi:hypothetical protein